jgi:hypothetical protein
MVVTLRARVQLIGGPAGRDLSGTFCSSNKVYVINLQCFCLITFECISVLNKVVIYVHI